MTDNVLVSQASGGATRIRVRRSETGGVTTQIGLGDGASDAETVELLVVIASELGPNDRDRYVDVVERYAPSVVLVENDVPPTWLEATPTDPKRTGDGERLTRGTGDDHLRVVDPDEGPTAIECCQSNSEADVVETSFVYIAGEPGYDEERELIGRLENPRHPNVVVRTPRDDGEPGLLTTGAEDSHVVYLDTASAAQLRHAALCDTSIVVEPVTDGPVEFTNPGFGIERDYVETEITTAERQPLYKYVERLEVSDLPADEPLPGFATPDGNGVETRGDRESKPLVDLLDVDVASLENRLSGGWARSEPTELDRLLVDVAAANRLAASADPGERVGVSEE